MKNNLMPEYRNTFWRVTGSFHVYRRVGICDSNTYFGSSQALGVVYEYQQVSVGQEIHALVGGTFLVDPDKCVTLGQISIAITDKHPFEKTYFPREDAWPLDKLEPINWRTAPPGGYTHDRRSFTRADLAEVGAQSYGRSIDYVYNT